MSNLIFLTGTHGSGKTYLAEKLEDEHGFKFYRSNASTFTKSYGGLKVQIDPSDRLKLQCEILTAWKQQYHDAVQLDNTDVVFDRCPLDFLAYTNQEYDKLYNNPEYHRGYEQYHLDCLLATVTITMRPDCKIVYVPMMDEFSNMDRGELKGAVGHYAKIIDIHIRGIAADNNLKLMSIGKDRHTRLHDLLGIINGKGA